MLTLPPLCRKAWSQAGIVYVIAATPAQRPDYATRRPILPHLNDSLCFASACCYARVQGGSVCVHRYFRVCSRQHASDARLTNPLDDDRGARYFAVQRLNVFTMNQSHYPPSGTWQSLRKTATKQGYYAPGGLHAAFSIVCHGSNRADFRLRSPLQEIVRVHYVNNVISS